MVFSDTIYAMLLTHDKYSQFTKKKIPFIFDPGQGMPMFNGDDLRHFIEQATWVTVNDYEWELLKSRPELLHRHLGV